VIETKPTFGCAVQPAPSALAITVLYTSIRPTLTALRRAASLARDLGATIRILHLRSPLEHPSPDREALARSFHTLAEGRPIPTRVETCYGRDIVDSLLHSLSPNSIVLIGAQPGWWPSQERRWAKLLSRYGHHIIVVPVESNS